MVKVIFQSGKVNCILTMFTIACIAMTLVFMLIPALAVAEQPATFISFSSSFRHTLAVGSDGTVWAWGSNERGECGNVADAERYVLAPVKVEGLTDITAVAAGSRFSLALASNGTVWSWGDNKLGQLGIGKADDGWHGTPVQVPGLDGVIYITASFSNALALKSDGTAWAWGINSHGESGDGKQIDVPTGSGDTHAYTYQNRPSPCRVTGLDRVISVSLAGSGSNGIALEDDGTVWVWGINNELLGNWGEENEDAEYTSTPVRVAEIKDAIKVSGATSAANALILKSDGTVWTWGKNDYGALGIGNKNADYYTLAPVQVGGLSNIIDIASGPYSLALSEDGNVWAWGWGKFYGTGTGSQEDQYAPAAVPELSDIASIYRGGYSNFAVGRDGTIWAWGLDDHGQLGDGRYGDFDVCIQTPTKVLHEFSLAGTTTEPTSTPIVTSKPTDAGMMTPTAIPSAAIPTQNGNDYSTPDEQKAIGFSTLACLTVIAIASFLAMRTRR